MTKAQRNAAALAENVAVLPAVLAAEEGPVKEYLQAVETSIFRVDLSVVYRGVREVYSQKVIARNVQEALLVMERYLYDVAGIDARWVGRITPINCALVDAQVFAVRLAAGPEIGIYGGAE